MTKEPVIIYSKGNLSDIRKKVKFKTNYDVLMKLIFDKYANKKVVKYENKLTSTIYSISYPEIDYMLNEVIPEKVLLHTVYHSGGNTWNKGQSHIKYRLIRLLKDNGWQLRAINGLKTLQFKEYN